MYVCVCVCVYIYIYIYRVALLVCYSTVKSTLLFVQYDQSVPDIYLSM